MNMMIIVRDADGSYFINPDAIVCVEQIKDVPGTLRIALSNGGRADVYETEDSFNDKWKKCLRERARAIQKLPI